METGTRPPAHGDRAIFRTYGPLDHLSPIPLAQTPTPLEPLDLSAVIPGFSGRARVKREDLSGHEIGGNKVRKLEWLLGRALASGRRRVLTSGGIGSNHALATTFHAVDHGMDPCLVIFPHHVSPASRRTLRAIAALGPRMTFCPTDTMVPAVMALEFLRLRASGRGPAVLLPGGSQPMGTLGAVDLGCELAEQILADRNGIPDAVFVPYGSGGTAAGLSLGLRAAGVSCPVLAVRVYPLPLTSRSWLRVLVSGTQRLLSRASPERPSRPDPADLRIVDGYLGSGYAEPTPAAAAAREVASDLGLSLEPTYSAKAFAALLDAASEPPWREADLVFVLTYDHRIPEELEAADDLAVPERLRRYL